MLHFCRISRENTEGLDKIKFYRNPSGEPPRASLQEKLLKAQFRRNTSSREAKKHSRRSILEKCLKKHSQRNLFKKEHLKKCFRSNSYRNLRKYLWISTWRNNWSTEGGILSQKLLEEVLKLLEEYSGSISEKAYPSGRTPGRLLEGTSRGFPR